MDGAEYSDEFRLEDREKILKTKPRTGDTL